jgi:hypothetical protein
MRSSDVKKGVNPHGMRLDDTKTLTLLTKLQQALHADVEIHGGLSLEGLQLCTDYAILNEHYVYEVLDATKEAALSLIDLLSQLKDQAIAQGNPIHYVFFFTLAAVLKVKYEIGAPWERVKREDFERSFSETRDKYRLGLK